MNTSYGTALGRVRPHDIIGEVYSPSQGNLALRIGNLHEDNVRWEQTAYVVLDRGEARAFVLEILDKVLGVSADALRGLAELLPDDPNRNPALVRTVHVPEIEGRV